jgi:hypothetical protein
MKKRLVLEGQAYILMRRMRNSYQKDDKRCQWVLSR